MRLSIIHGSLSQRAGTALLSAGLTTLGLCLAAVPAAARDLQIQTDPQAPTEDVVADRADSGPLRTAQFWPFFGPRQSAPAPEAQKPDARYYYVQSRDIFGKPGPVYRVLGVEKPKAKRPGVDRHKMRAAEQLRKAPPAPATTGPLLVAVSLAKQQLTLYDQGVAVATSPISTGTAKNPTPTGVFSVIQKQWWHRSNLYSSAPMPFMQRLTWSGIALHAGELPGYPASHGCIRLPDDFAIRMWGTTRVGARIIITQGEITPVDIAHPRLFAPKPKQQKPEPAEDTPMASTPPATIPALPATMVSAAPPASASVSAPAVTASITPAIPAGALAGIAADAAPLARQGQLALADVPITASVLDRAAADEGMRFLANLNNTLTLVNPDGSPVTDEYGATESNEDDDKVTATVPATGKTRTITIVRPGQPNEVLEISEAPQIKESGTASITVVRGGRQVEIEVIAVNRVEPAAQVAVLRLPEADEPPILLAHNGTAFAAARLRRDRRVQNPVEPVLTPPAPLARPLRPGPVSVFVSRKERRLYVRKGFEPLFDTPVSITNPERALGNHVFTALSVGETDARWSVVSLPVESIKTTQVYERVRYRRDENGRLVPRKVRKQRTNTEVVSAPPPASAREALDRIEMPADAVIRITELLSAGATLIVSDEGLGRETGRETDFTVLTK